MAIKSVRRGQIDSRSWPRRGWKVTIVQEGYVGGVRGRYAKGGRYSREASKPVLSIEWEVRREWTACGGGRGTGSRSRRSYSTSGESEERRCLEDIRAQGRARNRQDRPGEIPFPVPVCPATPLDNPSAGLQYGGTMSWVEALEPWPS